MSWLLFSKMSASVSLPLGPSKTYFFSTTSHGNSRLCRLNSSRSPVNSFSFLRNAVRALIHSSCETIECFVTLLPASLAIFFLQSIVNYYASQSILHLWGSPGEIGGEFFCDRSPSVFVTLRHITVEKLLMCQHKIGFVALR